MEGEQRQEKGKDEEEEELPNKRFNHLT